MKSFKSILTIERLVQNERILESGGEDGEDRK
jgi:hypothetical protein